MGLIMAKSLADFFHKGVNIENINRCLNAGVSFKKIKTIKPSSITGKIFVFTGSLENYSRKDAQKLIESYGARLSNSLSTKTNYLITGNSPGSKVSNAQSLNIEILTELQFIKLIKSL